MHQDQKGRGKYNVVVIGAGTAGLVTAAGTAGLGGRVALIEGKKAGPYAFTHGADYQARIVIRNILLPWFKAKASYRWMPWVTYTDPEVAHFGPTEEARARNVAYDVFRYDWEELDRAVTDSETEGFIKVLTARGKERSWARPWWECTRER